MVEIKETVGLEDVLQVLEDLHFLDDSVIIVGGASLEFYLDDLEREHFRPTEDVDVLVEQVVTRMDWVRVEQELRKNDWQPDMRKEAPLCRYISPSGVTVDIMSSSEDVLGFTNPWYEDILKDPKTIQIEGKEIKIAQPAHFFATKIEAFNNRGKVFPYTSNDLDDIVVMVDGCRELVDSIQSQSPEFQRWIAEQLSSIKEEAWFEDHCLHLLPRRGYNMKFFEDRFLNIWDTLLLYS